MGHRFEELKHRVEAKKKEYQSKIETAKADQHAEAAERNKKLKQKLDELEIYVKDGWENLTDSTAAKLSDWLK